MKNSHMNLMFHRITAFTAAFMLSFQGMSQVVIDQADMPSAGDTLRVSVTGLVPAGYAATAMDTAWNFAALEAMTQRVDTFVSATATPSAYQLFFVLLGGANLAAPMTSVPIPNMPVSQGFTFYKNSPTAFSELGSAYTVQGLPLPAKYDEPDKLYQFPMTPGLGWSSVSAFDLAIPDLAAISTLRNRTSLVDGWGTLITPFGTFQTLRVKSMLTVHDSIFIDSLGSGFSINRDITEYKWLAKGEGIPVLQVSEEGNMSTAIYRDTYRMPAQQLSVSLGPDTTVAKGAVITLRATVSGGTPPYRVMWSTLDTGATITVTIQESQSFSVLVSDALQNFGTAQKMITVAYPPGMKEPGESSVRVRPNPTVGPVRIIVPDAAGKALVRVIDGRGEIRRSIETEVIRGEVVADLAGLADGLYCLRIVAGDRVCSAKVMISGR